MFRIHLNRILNISVLLFLLVSLTPSYSKTIYKWVDEDGTIHFTDDPKNIPEDKKEKAVVIEGEEPGGETEVNSAKMAPAFPEEENPEADLEKKREEEALREDFRSRALEINDKEKALLEEIKTTKEQISQKKREVDLLLIYGYFADYSISELRYLNDYLSQLEDQLALIKQERESLEEEARREGIPPGYLRP
jgi:ATP-dependent Lon protease